MLLNLFDSFALNNKLHNYIETIVVLKINKYLIYTHVHNMHIMC